MDRQIDKLIDRQINRCRWINRNTDRQTDWRENR